MTQRLLAYLLILSTSSSWQPVLAASWQNVNTFQNPDLFGVTDCAWGRSAGSNALLIGSESPDAMTGGKIYQWVNALTDMFPSTTIFLPTTPDRARVNSVDWSPDDTSLVASYSLPEMSAFIYDSFSAAVLLIASHASGVNSAMYNSDGTLIITGSSDSTSITWNAPVGPLQATFTHGGPVTTCRFIDQGSFIGNVVSTSNDLIQVWDPITGAAIASTSPTGSSVLTGLSEDGSASFSQNCVGPTCPANVDLISGISFTGPIGTANLYTDNAPILTDAQKTVNSDITALATALFSKPLGCTFVGSTIGTIYAGFNDGSLGILTGCNSVTGSSMMTTMAAHSSQINWVAATVGGSTGYLATASNDGTAKIWNIDNGGTVSLITTITASITTPVATKATRVKFQPNNNTVLAICFDNGEVQIWQLL